MYNLKLQVVAYCNRAGGKGRVVGAAVELDQCKEGSMAGEPEGGSESGREHSGDVRERGICVGSLVWVCGGFMEVHTALQGLRSLLSAPAWPFPLSQAPAV